ncbi:MAG: hypothetical protein J6Q80_00200 [Lentisphaeria bacterium]|nr:hypothetical protein [Lentisphaeria bacterium]
MAKYISKLSGAALGILILSGCVTAEQKNEPAPQVRTIADQEKGKRNVQSVAQELQTLFNSNPPAKLKQQLSRQATPAFSKIVPIGDNRSTLVFRPRYSTAKKISRALEGVMPLNSLVEPVIGQNLVIVSAETSAINNYKKLIEAMDVPQAQVLIEAKVVELIFSDATLRNLSVSWNGKHGSLGAVTEIPGQTSQLNTGWQGSFTPIHGENTMNIAFKWLENAQDAKVLSSPTILLSTCDEASKITTGEEIPIQEANTVSDSLSITTKFKSVGVTLEVEPSLINDDNVTLRVFPKVSTVTRYETISTGSGTGATQYSVPVIAARSIETFLKMHHEQVVMMGGLYSSTKTLQEERVPGLSDIPLIGDFFTGKNDSTEITQLVFFLKVHIIPPSESAEDFFFDIDRNAKLSEALGEVVRSTESFPIRKTTVEKVTEDILRTIPGNEKRKRDDFRRSDLTIKEQGAETPASAAPGKKNGAEKKDNK